ncbi:hypothetical protein GCM10028807_60570 [Spirosoma daeguense]
MEPLNKSERNTSLFNFIAVYVIVLALPLFLAYWMGTKRSSKGGGQKAVVEQEALAKDMDALQQYVLETEKENSSMPQETDSFEQKNSWIAKAEQRNTDFRRKINDFMNKKGYTGARDRIRKNACNYLIQMTTERSNYLQKRKEVLGSTNQSAYVKQLQGENAQLKMQAQGLQNNINTLNTVMAQAKQQAAGGGGGGGQQPNPEVENLKWMLKISDANCKKSQADILEAYNDNSKRRQLYTAARLNFQQISQSARNSYTIQQLASDKIQEIDRQISRLQ